MKTPFHIIYGAIFSGILLLFFHLTFITFLIVFFSTILIDFDHYLFYVYKKKSFNLKKAYKWYLKKEEKLSNLSKEQRKKFYTSIYLFHNIEGIILLLVLSQISKYFYYVLIGILFHLALDLIYDLYFSFPFEKFSIIFNIFKFKKLKYLD